METIVAQWSERIRAAAASRTALRIHGGRTKDFYGEAPTGEPFDTRALRGIVQYEPTELVVTARCGTPLAELEAALHERQQRLAFEPPHFGDGATLGGAVATGLSGPGRAACGSARDFVLGVRLLDGRGDDLAFGGQVMKNVAGYDVSRLVTGALGTLGVLLEVSLKVLPIPSARLTLRQQAGADEAIRRVNAWAGQPLPITATAWEDGVLTVRLSGAEAGVTAAKARIGGEAVEDDDAFWRDLREHRLPFFAGDAPLWRLSIRSTTPALDLPGAQFVEWNGALRWLRSTAEPATIRAAAAAAGGHATLFRSADRGAGVFHPLPAPLLALHRRLKQTFDPAGILNPGRLHASL